MTNQPRRVLTRFRQIYGAQHRRLPPTLIEGLVLSILAGELSVNVDEPRYSPLREILPILRDAKEHTNV